MTAESWLASGAEAGSTAPRIRATKTTSRSGSTGAGSGVGSGSDCSIFTSITSAVGSDGSASSGVSTASLGSRDGMAVSSDGSASSGVSIADVGWTTVPSTSSSPREGLPTPNGSEVGPPDEPPMSKGRLEVDFWGSDVPSIPSIPSIDSFSWSSPGSGPFGCTWPSLASSGAS